MTTETRAALLAAAATLFADEGIDGPSLREITRAAGQRNTNALQYHFGDRDALLRALLDGRGDDVDAARTARLDAMAESPSLRQLAGVLVAPLVAQLDDRPGGPEYLQVAGEIVARPVRFAAVFPTVTARPSLRRWAQLVEAYLPPDAVGRPLHRRFAAIRFVHGELSSRARERRSSTDHRLFTSHLVDLVTALLSAPVSEETSGLIDREGRP